jgi:hypothetical protein
MARHGKAWQGMARHEARGGRRQGMLERAKYLKVGLLAGEGDQQLEIMVFKAGGHHVTIGGRFPSKI